MHARLLALATIACAVIAGETVDQRYSLFRYWPDTIIVRYIEASGQSHPVALVHGRLAAHAEMGVNRVSLTDRYAVVLLRLCTCRYEMAAEPRLVCTPVAPVCRSGLTTCGWTAMELTKPSVDGISYETPEERGETGE